MFNHIFAENFKNNQNATDILAEIRDGILATPAAVDYIVPRAHMLKVLEGVLDRATENFKMKVEEFHQNDNKTGEFLELIVAALQREGKTRTVEEVGGLFGKEMDW